MESTALIGAMLALTSGVVWGAGDFAGGLAGRRLHPFQVTFVAGLTGLILVTLIALFTRELLPSTTGIGFSILGGTFGGFGIAMLYRGLARGRVSIVAPIASVVGAFLPVMISAITEGLPGPLKLAGLGLGLLGILLVSSAKSSGQGSTRFSIVAGTLAGLGFGAFFVFMARGETVFTSLAIARVCTFLVGIGLMLSQKQKPPALFAHPLAMLSGVFDAAGNMFYVWAKQFTRLDVAAVLSSLYPASTIVLAWLILKDKIGRVQLIGVIMCLLAVALIATS